MSKIITPGRAFGIYLVCAFLTWGYLHSRAELFCAGQTNYNCIINREGGAVIAGWFWPVYWSGRAALAVTSP